MLRKSEIKLVKNLLEILAKIISPALANFFGKAAYVVPLWQRWDTPIVKLEAGSP
jgi:hypothetical protein